MRLHFLETIDRDGRRTDYTGPLGMTANFVQGLSVEAMDCDDYEVQRILRHEDGGLGVGPTVAIVKDNTTKGPEELKPPAPPPIAAKKADRMAKAREAKAAKRAAHGSG